VVAVAYTVARLTALCVRHQRDMRGAADEHEGTSSEVAKDRVRVQVESAAASMHRACIAMNSDSMRRATRAAGAFAVRGLFRSMSNAQALAPGHFSNWNAKVSKAGGSNALHGGVIDGSNATAGDSASSSGGTGDQLKHSGGSGGSGKVRGSLGRIFLPEAGTLASRLLRADPSLAIMSQCVGADKALRKQWRLALRGVVALPDTGCRLAVQALA